MLSASPRTSQTLDWSGGWRNRLVSRPTVFRQSLRFTATSALRPAARHSTSCLSPLASLRGERICQFFSHRWDLACFLAEAGSLAGSLLPPMMGEVVAAEAVR